MKLENNTMRRLWAGEGGGVFVTVEAPFNCLPYFLKSVKLGDVN